MIDFNDQRCGNCMFWQRQGPQIAAAARDPSSPAEIGVCRFSAPINTRLDTYSTGMWPRTHQDRWCGKWDVPDGGGDGGGETVVAFKPRSAAA